MKKFLMMIPAVAILASVTPVKAEVSPCIEGCNEDFPGGDPVSISIRGWCYIIRNCTFDQT